MKTTNTWCVYKHTSPSGKVYIGITHYKNPNYRYGKEGVNYKRCVVFWKAIEKYDWDNFTHEILYSDLSEKDAKTLEVKLIKKYKDQGISYNMTIGGDGHNMGCESNTAKYRTASSRIYRAKHPDWDKKQYIKHSEKKKQMAREYYAKHREEVLEYKRSEEVRNKARIRAAAWREKHPDYMKNYMKEYNKKKKETK